MIVPQRNKSTIVLIHLIIRLLFISSLLIVFWHHVLTNIIHSQIQSIEFPFGIRIDSLSSIMFVMVTLLGTAISRYALRYLDGEHRQSYFYTYLLFIILSVSLLVLSSNLLLFFGAWLLTSFGLHKLLCYYPHRPLAIRAARTKFVISRLGDLSLVLAIALTYHTFKTFEFSTLFSIATSLPANAPENETISLIGLLFAVGAMTKSAQFPFHFWLPETMETPTPVSALMHAGIINSGGFLILRLSPLLRMADLAHFLLIGMGSITAVFGAMVMITQNNIKKKLAYSTISQMGIMMLCCGMGAFSLALFHIVAHSFYKAHAFLSTGVLVEESKKEHYSHLQPSSFVLMISSIFGFVLIVLGAQLFGDIHIPHLTYLAILLLGMSQTIQIPSGAIVRWNFRFLLQIVAILTVATSVCGLIEFLLFHYIDSISPDTWGSEGVLLQRHFACITAYGVFVVGAYLSNKMIKPTGIPFQKLYMYFWNEGYLMKRVSR